MLEVILFGIYLSIGFIIGCIGISIILEIISNVMEFIVDKFV